MSVKILAVCGAGQGSSMIMKLKIKTFLEENNIDFEVKSCAVGEYKYEMAWADIIITSIHIAPEISLPDNKHLVGVNNMLSAADFGPKILDIINQYFPSKINK